MFSQSPVSYLVFNNPPMPKRHLSIITLHDRLSRAILNNSDLIKNSPAARAEMLHLALLYEGAQINSLLEEALISRLTLTDEKASRNIGKNAQCKKSSTRSNNISEPPRVCRRV